MTNLFQWGEFKSAAGKKLDFKIECDALADDDWRCIANIISRRIKFKHVSNVPTGAEKLAAQLALCSDDSSDTWLFVDDVWTTGNSMRKYATRLGFIEPSMWKGFVLFARGPLDENVSALFTYNEV